MNWTLIPLIPLLILLLPYCPSNCLSDGFDVDPEGYVMFCPCMGRFGNQIAQFLGAMSFAKALNRTLILPHFVEYIPYQRGSLQIPFEDYFRYKSLNAYHKSLTMDFFMGTVGHQVFPKGRRISICYGPRHGSQEKEGESRSCNAKDGNPFGPYWDHFGIDFDDSAFYGEKGLYYCRPGDSYMIERWKNVFPASEYPVLAFTGTPGAFPVEEPDVENQKYVVWSDKVWTAAQAIIQEKLDTPYLAIHMRNGDDFKRACTHIQEGRNFFGSAQCLGYSNEKGFLSQEMCFPSKKTIMKQVKAAVKKHKVNAIFISTDSDAMVAAFQKKFKKLKVYSPGPESDFKVDLCVMEMASHWIGNCVSTFSAYVTRSREIWKSSVEFWGFPDHVIPNPDAPEVIKFKTDIDIDQNGKILNEPDIQQVKDEL